MRQRSSYRGFWVSAVLLTLIVGAAVINRDTSARELSAAGGGSDTQLIAMPVLIQQGQEGFVLIDKQKQTMCVYKYESYQKRLKLLAARHFGQDLQLDNFNCADPTPEQVRELLDRPGETFHEAQSKAQGDSESR